MWAHWVCMGVESSTIQKQQTKQQLQQITCLCHSSLLPVLKLTVRCLWHSSLLPVLKLTVQCLCHSSLLLVLILTVMCLWPSSPLPVAKLSHIYHMPIALLLLAVVKITCKRLWASLCGHSNLCDGCPGLALAYWASSTSWTRKTISWATEEPFWRALCSLSRQHSLLLSAFLSESPVNERCLLPALSHQPTWCFMLSQPLRLCQGDWYTSQEKKNQLFVEPKNPKTK